MSEELDRDDKDIIQLLDYYLTLSELAENTLQVSRDFAYGFYAAGIEIAAIPLAIPTAIRKIRTRDSVIQTAHKEEKGFELAHFMGLGASLAPAGLAALAITPIAIEETYHGHYLPALLIAGSNAVSFVYEGLRHSVNSLDEAVEEE
ncbi:MAG: hypothetical protein AABX03_01120 [Nanoarchaeota archaeon]